MYGGWFNWASTATLQNWGDNARSIPYPILPDAKQTAVFVQPAQMICVSINSNHVEEAVRFLDFFFNDPDAAIALKDVRAIPPVAKNRDLLSDMGLLSSVVVDGVNLAVANIGQPQNMNTDNQEVTALYDTAFERMIFGQVTPSEAADEFIAQLEILVARMKAES
jgi:oligogalacturonide transport system substrate-binding protein